MTVPLLDGCAAVCGRGTARSAAVATLMGALTLAVAWPLAGGSISLGALAASWLFFAGLAAGGVAVSAAIRLSRGRWAAAALPHAEATAGFFPAALVLLAVLVLGAAAWIPGAPSEDWADWAIRAGRDLGATALLFAAGSRYLRRSRALDAEARRANRAATAYLLLYVATLSIWAVDLVMDLRAWAPSTVIPPFVFAGAFLGAIAWTALATALRKAPHSEPRTRHDLGKLMFAFVILWGYLLWSAYLPVWYGNMPDETGQLLARWSNGWRFAFVPVLVTVLLFPFFFLLPEANKRGRRGLAVAALSILAGLLGERYLLVLPSLPVASGWIALATCAGVTAGVGGLFVLAWGASAAAREADPRTAPERR
jgi:hypothetical protein